jgi:NAD(P)-dependent dehydrogenase (short-subunit alcohol dehydrogenase family)
MDPTVGPAVLTICPAADPGIVFSRTGCDTFTMGFDLSDTEKTIDFYRKSVRTFGVPEVLINNAGFNSRKAPLWEYTLEEFDRMFAVNVRGAFVLLQKACRDMTARGNGTIVSILSTSCHPGGDKLLKPGGISEPHSISVTPTRSYRSYSTVL